MSQSSRTDADRRAYCLKNLRRYLDLMMDDTGANASAAMDAQRAAWARQASFWAGILAALPSGKASAPPPGKPSRPLPPRSQSTPPQK
jgi:hypothetical protein